MAIMMVHIYDDWEIIVWRVPCMALYVFVSCSARTDVEELDGTSGPG